MKIQIDPVLNEIQNRLISGQSGFMATHDTTLVMLLQGLGSLWDGVWPKYAEAVAIERHVATDGSEEEIIRVVRNGVPIASLNSLDFNQLFVA